MEYNQPSLIVKDLNFGEDAKTRIIAGVDKLAQAVKSTLGASGKCVVYEDALGKPVITKDGVTVAESVVLYDPVENMGATMIKEASKNTVKEAGDGTTTAIVLAEALLKQVNNDKITKETNISTREIKNGIETGLGKINKYLNDASVKVEGNLLEHVSSISCNNDKELGKIISKAYEKVGKDGIVLMEESPTGETYMDMVDGVQIDCPLKSQHLITDKDKGVAVLDNPLILISSSPIPNVRKIQNVLEHCIKSNRSLLIIGVLEQQPSAALLTNKVKGNIKVNFIDLPGFGPTKDDTIEDLAIVTGAKVINEQLGDDFELINPDCLGEAVKVVTDDKHTVFTISKQGKDLNRRIKQVKSLIKKEDNNPYIKNKLEDRLAILSGSVGIVFVGADSKIELKEKKDRVEDAIYATKAALKEGIVPGGGIALLNAADNINVENIGEKILVEAIKSPFITIMANAGIENYETPFHQGVGFDVTTGQEVDMIKAGIVDPVLVTKTALKNAVSVINTIISADCVISNMRTNEGG
jgi:chaperonin GroEL